MPGASCSRRQRTGTERLVERRHRARLEDEQAGVEQHRHGGARRGLADADEVPVGGELADRARDRAALGGDAGRVVVGRQPEVDELACRLWVHGASSAAPGAGARRRGRGRARRAWPRTSARPRRGRARRGRRSRARSTTPMLAVMRRPSAIASHGSSRRAARTRSQQASASASVGARHQQHELLAAGARDDVVGADLLAQQLGHAHEHAVAGLVPEAVVDRLEVVDVEHGQADGPATSRRRSRWRRLCSPVSGSRSAWSRSSSISIRARSSPSCSSDSSRIAVRSTSTQRSSTS